MVWPPTQGPVEGRDLNHCHTPEVADDVLQATLRRKQEFSAGLQRVEAKAQLMAGYSAAFLGVVLGRLGKGEAHYGVGVAATLALASSAGMACLAVCVATAPIADSANVLFVRQALEQTSPTVGRRLYALTLAKNAYRTSLAVDFISCRKAWFLVRSELAALIGTVLAVCWLTILP